MNFDDKVLDFKMNPDSTVMDLKDIIELSEKIPIRDQNLTWNNSELPNTKELNAISRIHPIVLTKKISELITV